MYFFLCVQVPFIEFWAVRAREKQSGYSFWCAQTGKPKTLQLKPTRELNTYTTQNT